MDEEKILYHYTSISSANSILVNRNIWLSDCRFLNDVNELEAAKNQFFHSFDGSDRHALEYTLNFISFRFSHCLFSLSESSQILSQWRAYGTDGHGVSLGFDSKIFTSTVGEKLQLIKCEYKKHDIFITDTIRKLRGDINKILKFRKKYKIDSDFLSHISEITAPSLNIITELLKVKNDAFSEEKEYRLVRHVERTACKTRVSKELLVPYSEFSYLDDSEERFLDVAVPEIWLGPKCDVRNKMSFQSIGNVARFPATIKQYNCGYL